MSIKCCKLLLEWVVGGKLCSDISMCRFPIDSYVYIVGVSVNGKVILSFSFPNNFKFQMHQFCLGQIWSKCHQHISCNVLFLCFPDIVLCIFLQKIEGKSLLCYMKWVIPWQCLFQVGKISCTENNLVLELLWEDLKTVLL